MEERRPPLIVVDCSIAISAVMEDERDADALEIFEQFRDSSLAILVPAHFLLETCNVLLIQLRRKRLLPAQYERKREYMLTMPFEIDEGILQPSRQRDISLLAEQYSLTVYNAAYLELAQRRKARLATLDADLRKAAVKAKVALFK